MSTDQGPKRPSKKSPEQVAKDLLVEQRRGEVAKLKLKGKTNREIAAKLGVGATTVDRDLKAVFARTRAVADNAIRVQRAISLEQIELGIQATMRLIAPESEGEEEPLTDELTIKAINAFKGLDERRSKNLGLEAPQQLVLLAVEQGLAQFVATAKRVLPDEWFIKLAAELTREGSEGSAEVGSDDDQPDPVH